MVSKECLEEIEYYSKHPWNEKTAKDMFEELGYKQVKKTDYSVRYEAYEFYIEIWKREEMDDFLVRKSMLQKEYVCNLWGEELKAIHKQCEELGW